MHVTAGSPAAFGVDVPVAMNINQAPAVAVVDPANDAAFLVGESISLTASAEDPDGIKKVEFYEGANKISEVAQPPYRFVWNAPSGSFSISAKAVDSFGAVGISQPISVRKDHDADNDGLGDEWEVNQFGNLDQQSGADYDSDGLTNLQEYRAHLAHKSGYGRGRLSDELEVNVYQTNALSADSDGDGISDGWEVRYGLNPLAQDGDDDTDKDGLSDKLEFLYQTDPHNPDSDGDGVPDGEDGWANDATFSPPRLPDYHYALIDLGPGTGEALNNNGVVVGHTPSLCKFSVAYGQRSNVMGWLSDINDAGDMVGVQAWGTVWINGQPEIFRDSNGQALLLESVEKINNGGTVVGFFSGGARPLSSVYGTNRHLQRVSNILLQSINSDGLMAGAIGFYTGQTSFPPPESTYAALIRGSEVVANLGRLPAPYHNASFATDLNDASEVTGGH